MNEYSHILLTTDGSEEDEIIGDHARRLAESFGARLSLLRVVEQIPFDEPGDVIIPPEGWDKVEVFRANALEALRGFAKRIGLPETVAHAVVTAGSVAREILHFSREHDVDLIVVGARERHGLAIFHRSVANKVVHDAPCDVLAVHVKASID
jgi:universal stress protein A